MCSVSPIVSNRILASIFSFGHELSKKMRGHGIESVKLRFVAQINKSSVKRLLKQECYLPTDKVILPQKYDIFADFVFLKSDFHFFLSSCVRIHDGSFVQDAH